MGRSSRLGPWSAVFLSLALLAAVPRTALADFPKSFPTEALAHNLDLLRPPNAMPRILTSDQWADYLIFRLYPRQRVFFDGRSDFYDPAIGSDYQALFAVRPGWHDTLERYGFEIALLPLDWPLGSVLERDPGWRTVYRDSVALLLVRNAAGPAPAYTLKESSVTAECKPASE